MAGRNLVDCEWFDARSFIISCVRRASLFPTARSLLDVIGISCRTGPTTGNTGSTGIREGITCGKDHANPHLNPFPSVPVLPVFPVVLFLPNTDNVFCKALTAMLIRESLAWRRRVLRRGGGSRNR